MFQWNCEYCKTDYFELKLCVYHELNECKKIQNLNIELKVKNRMN